MGRRWNPFVWAGFLVTVFAFISYFILFYRFPITRDVPWVNLLLFAAGGWLLADGLKRAFQHPERYRGKISGSILAALSLGVLGLFGFYTLYLGKQLPASSGAPRVGQKAPDFLLPDKDGNPVSLSKLLPSPDPGAGVVEKPIGVVLIFYRGYW